MAKGIKRKTREPKSIPDDAPRPGFVAPRHVTVAFTRLPESGGAETAMYRVLYADKDDTGASALRCAVSSLARRGVVLATLSTEDELNDPHVDPSVWDIVQQMDNDDSDAEEDEGEEDSDADEAEEKEEAEGPVDGSGAPEAVEFPVVDVLSYKKAEPLYKPSTLRISKDRAEYTLHILYQLTGC